MDRNKLKDRAEIQDPNPFDFTQSRKLVEFERVRFRSSSAHKNLSRVELVKWFELKNLAQIRLIII
jgi:hypothetical protein